jgi:hypothetical protein
MIRFEPTPKGLACALALAWTFGAFPLAHATETGAPHTPAPVIPDVLPFKSDTSDWRGGRPKNGYWSLGEPRWFLSSKSDVGGIYVKPYISAGYGLPHWIWAGVDANAITTPEFGQFYTGLRGSTPIFDLALGVRDTYSYQRGFLAPRSRYVVADLQNYGDNAHYWAWEGEVVGVIPLPYSAILLDYIAVGVLNRPAGKYLYEESYRAVVGKSLFHVVRVAAVARLLREDALKLGVLAELVTGTGRGESVVRMGPAASLQLTDHLEMLGTLSLKVASPDRLGLALGAYGVSGFRYRWATGERAPKAPWQGRLIP